MIEEIGEAGYEHLKKTLRFGDIIENELASKNNPRRIGIIVKARAHSINITDGNGNFWDLVFDAQSKIKIHGNVLNDNYHNLTNSKK